jgi:site-specific recombinase XerC
MSQPDPHHLAAVQQMMETLGVSISDLTDTPGQASSRALVPTVREFHAVVLALATPGQRRTYANHWRSLVAEYGERQLHDLRKTELETVVQAAKTNARRRANSREGRGAQENCVAALRHFFAKAVDDGLLRDNPALKLTKPRRHASDRRPLKPAEVEQLHQVCATTGDDPSLDTLLFRFHLETGARRGGGLALRLRDLNHDEQTVLLREKGETQRWVPVSATLLAALLEHAASRGATEPDDSTFRYKPRRGQTAGRPLTYRRYDNLYARWQAALPWADKVHVSGHWLRHTAVAEVERLAGFGAARRFAGHQDESAATTLTYIRSDTEAVAAATAIRTGEAHPLAPNALPCPRESQAGQVGEAGPAD